jgi:hypothetical protein
MEQLKVGTNDSPSVAKKKVTAAAMSVSSTEAFSTTGYALQLEVPTVVAASIRGQKVGGECWNSGLDCQLEAVVTSIHLEAVAATSKAARVLETLPTHHGWWPPYENPVT